MKKTVANILFLLMFFISSGKIPILTNKNSTKTDNTIEVGIGLNNISSKNNFGKSLSLNYKKIHLDLSNNFEKGTGKKENYRDYNTILTNKKRTGIFNLGYKIYNGKLIYIIPKIGFGWELAIYQNTNSWFIWGQKDYINIGINTGIKISKNITTELSYGSFEKLGFHFIFKLP